MLMIRFFLWGLVAAMTLQGFIHADEYGSAVGLMGGMSLTMSVWSESLSEGTRSLFWSKPSFAGLPRTVIQAALRETARHPGIHTVPALRKALDSHSKAWTAFRDSEVSWMLDHADLVGAILVEPDARALWKVWSDRLNITETRMEDIVLCKLPSLDVVHCGQLAHQKINLQMRAAIEKRAVRAWSAVLAMVAPIDVENWWGATQPSASASASLWPIWNRMLSQLHNISEPKDGRIAVIRTLAASMAHNLTMNSTTDRWTPRLLESLLVGELLRSCLQHVAAREGRVRELMTATGIADLVAAHERILNASLRVTMVAAEQRIIQDWFGEMASYAWWLGDDIPGLVRRCLNQQAGDCARSGPTEIAALSAQMDERMRIVEDWVRRLFVGMWNALPAVALLFVVELVALCVERRSPAPSVSMMNQEPRTIVLQLQGPTGQIVAERQMISG